MFGKRDIAKDGPASTARRRGWFRSVAWAAVLVGLFLALAVGINVAIGRRIHWDIVAGFAVAGTVSLAITHRYRIT